MTTLAEKFAGLGRQGRRALIPFFTAGFPSERSFLRLLGQAPGWGADVVEIGIPHSDPLADGLSIQYSSRQALAQGVTLRSTLAALGRARRELDSTTPLVVMTYVNPVLALGWRVFAREAAAAGLSGVIVPDLPPEEGAPLEQALGEAGLDLVYLAAPTTGEERLAEIGRRSRGFLYLVSTTGVTGSREGLPPELPAFVRRARRATRLPLCLGFGIARGETARQAAALVDGVIVGSAIVDAIRVAGREGDAAACDGDVDGAVGALLRELRGGLDALRPGGSP